MSSVIPNLTECRLGSACRIVDSVLTNQVESVSWTNDCYNLMAPLDNVSATSAVSESSTCSVTSDIPNSSDALRTPKPGKSASRNLFRSCRSGSSTTTTPESDLQLSSAADSSASSTAVDHLGDGQSQTAKSGWDPGSAGLLRLFESPFFNMDLALQYLYKAKDSHARQYLVNRLYDFPEVDVDFYLLQLLSLYKMSPELGRLLYPYFIFRCSKSAEFAIHVVWLLDTFAPVKRDSTRAPTTAAVSSALSRPSSVPTFSQSANLLSTFSQASEPADGSDPSNPEGSQPNPLPEVYTLQGLRAVLFPTQESSLLLLGHYASAANQFAFDSSRVPSTACGGGVAGASSNAPVNRPTERATLPKTSEPGHLLAHKRTVSDVAAPTISSFPCKLNHASLSRGHQPNRSVAAWDRWLSVDSAVELCTELRRTHALTTAAAANGAGVAGDGGGSLNLGLDSQVMPTKPTAPLAAGSLTCVDKLTPLETRPADVARNSRHMASADPVGGSSVAHRQLMTTVEPGDDAAPSPTVSSAAPRSSSASPPDSGLHLAALESSDEHCCYARPSAVNPADDAIPDDPVIQLQLQLVPRLIPEWDFVDSLLRLGRRLVPITSKEQRTAYLQAELANLNLHLPARVWLPVCQTNHIVLRIPPTAAVCLNSKDKAPYLIYLEVLTCTDRWSCPVPSRRSVHRPRSGFPAYHPPTSSSYASLSSGCSWHSHSPSSLSPAQPEESLSPHSDGSGHWSDGSPRHSQHPPDCLSTGGSEPSEPSMCTAKSESNPDGANMAPAPARPASYVAAGAIRNRLKQQLAEHHPHRSFKSDPEDPSAAVLKEPWYLKCQRIRDLSPWGALPGWHLTAAIVKVGDDLRQEQLAYQLLSLFKTVWRSEYVPLWLRPLTVIVTSADSGLIEPVPDTVSLHQIRRHARLSLLDYYLREHGPATSEAFLTAQRNFVESCAAYCLVSYLLQVKDRHNGNILVDSEGHLIHIDYGFMLSASPGKNLGFEMSPFKLTTEQVAVMGGLGSDMFEYFKCLLLRGLLAARKHMDEICLLVEISRTTCPQLPCFSRSGGSTAISGLRQRFQLSRTEDQLRQLVDRMVETALHSVTTRLYDSYQYYTNGIQ